MSGGSNERVLSVDRVPVRRALLSVFDKTGLESLARKLVETGVELFSTGGTESFLRSCGFSVTSVSDLTGFPEVFDGRVKTLHPLVHGGLLYRRELESHKRQAQDHNVEAIDLLVVNLYPFEETVRKPGASHADIVEQIDIGGPAMVRSAAKNYVGVAVLTSPDQYASFERELTASQGSTTLELRERLAAEAFARIADYDVAIASYFESRSAGASAAGRLKIDLPLSQSLRYGENPQQRAALYGTDFAKIFGQLWGKELSYNNILDVSAASLLMSEFAEHEKAVAAIIKHTTPCGVAEGATVEEAFERAFQTDPESPFGGIIITNRPMTAALAQRINEFFSEVILAPEYDPEALKILQKKKDRRLLTLAMKELTAATRSSRELRSVVGGVLEQDGDSTLFESSNLNSVTSRSVTPEELEGLIFAWKVVKHVKSNAIVYTRADGEYSRTLGIGGGQTSRVESSRLAVGRAKQFGHSLEGSFVASDAFFPFADGLLEAVRAGARAVIQPGGSVRDQEVIEAAEANGVALVLTGMRHFKH